MFSQSSLIASPLVLSAIYSINHDAIYYFSMIFSVTAALLMIYVSTWPNGKMLGKQGNAEKKELPVVKQKGEEVRGEDACVNSEQEKNEQEKAQGPAVEVSNQIFSTVTVSFENTHDFRKDV